MDRIDSFLNKTTMYRLMLSSLATLAAITLVLAFFRFLPYTPLVLCVSFIALLFAAWASNSLFALFTKAAPTPESALITALILFFIVSPVQSASDVLLLMLVAAIAMLSKYVLAVYKKHVFNPVAIAVLIMSIAGSGIATWWVATPILLPFVAVAGFLVVRKLRRFDLFLAFVLTAFVVFLVRTEFAAAPLLASSIQFLLSWPLIFFGTVMLTEPQTMPSSRTDRLIFGVIVGFLFSLSFNFGTLSATPEFALIIGNLYAFAVNYRRRITLTLQSILPLTRNVYEYVFVPDRPFPFIPGQYMEWTAPHRKTDRRGIRRYFTIASAPSDTHVRVGVRVPVESSSFKRALRELKPGDKIQATGITGSFTLPSDPKQKIAAIAGGIGITPFMSMFRQLRNRGERRDIVLIYSAATPLDFTYQEELESYKDSIGLRILYLPTDFTEVTAWTGPSGYITDALIKKEIPDFAKRHWYLSGPNAMVTAYKKLIRILGIHAGQIKTDYFPGF